MWSYIFFYFIHGSPSSLLFFCIFAVKLEVWVDFFFLFLCVVEYYEAIFRAFISDVCLFSWDGLHNLHIENSPFGMTECIITNALFHITSSGGTPYCFPIFH